VPKPIFISYDTSDSEMAQEVCSMFENAGLPCWIAPRDIPPGREYGEAIIEGLEWTRAYVLVMTQSSFGSRHVMSELERAFSKQKPIVAIRLDDTQIPKSFELYVSAFQWIDARGVPIHTRCQELVTTVRALVGPGGSPASASKNANQARTPAAVLIGSPAADTAYITGSIGSNLWRGCTGFPSLIRFSAPPDGFRDGQNELTLRIDARRPEFYVGRNPEATPPNDLVLAHPGVSRQAIVLTERDGRVVVALHPACGAPVYVGLSQLASGVEKPLHHGQALSIGPVTGVFLDGRFASPSIPADAVDERTGLLGREGVAWEIAISRRLGSARVLFMARPTARSLD